MDIWEVGTLRVCGSVEDTPFAAPACEGHGLETMFVHYHFTPDSSELNSAYRVKDLKLQLTVVHTGHSLQFNITTNLSLGRHRQRLCTHTKCHQHKDPQGNEL